MVKKININPETTLNDSDIVFKKINTFKYQKKLYDELKEKTLNKTDALEIYKEMLWIRVNEVFLDFIKIKGEWKGIPYVYNGPAHMAAGQEAAVVGLHWLLDENDFIFGTHRNHGEVISKAMSAIYKMSDEKLEKIMNSYRDGEILAAINKTGKKFKSIKAKARFYFMYGFLTEIWAKKEGINRGLSGSMHLFFTPFGIYPNNAIVGASASLALGASLFKLTQNKKGIVVANIGDGGVSTGPFWETLNFASMDQFKELWDKPYNKRPPFMVNVMNNGYGMGGQTIGETMGNKGAARIGAGINPDNMHAEKVNGQDVLATIDLIRRKKPIAKDGDGPILNEIITYRYNGHSSGDLESYRTAEEIEKWRKIDPIEVFGKELIENKIINNKKELEKIKEEIEDTFLQIYKLSIDPNITHELDWENDQQLLDHYMFSREKTTISKDKAKAEVRIKKEDNPRVKRISKRKRYAIGEDGKPLSKMKSYQIRDGIFEALLDKFHQEPTLATWGEELRDWGGAYGVYNGLTESLPYHRLFNSPIAEAAIVGVAIGYAMCGGQAVVELEYFDFLFRAGDEISNQVSKWRAMSGGQLRIPVVIRSNIGSQYGVQHSQDYTSVLASITGINVVTPVTPYDAKGLLNTALSSADPTFFIETQKLYDKGEFFVESGVPSEYYEIPFGEGVYRTRGDDLTIVTLGAALYTAIEAEKELQKYGIKSEIIDMRSAVPFDYQIIIDSVKKTGKVVLINEGFERMNFMKAVASNISEFAFDYLDAAPAVLGARNWIMPGADYEKYIYPQVEDILSTIHAKIIPLKNYQPRKNNTIVEYQRRAKYGV